MKLSINREVLLNGLNVVANGLPNKTPLNVLYSIKFSAVEGGVLLTTSKTDISIRTLIIDETLNVEEEGEVLVNGKLFNDIVKKISAKEIKLETDGNVLKLNANKSHYKLTTIDATEYPDINFDMECNPIVLNSNVISELIKTCAFCAAQSEKKPVLTGVNFSYRNGELVAVATDSFRLAENKYSIGVDDFPSVTVPSKSLYDLVKCLGDYEGDIELYINHNRMVVKFDTTEFQTILLEATYPNVERLLMGTYPIELEFNREDLIGAVERIAIMIPSDNVKDKELTYSVIKLKITSSTIELSSENSIIGAAKEEIFSITPIKETDAIELGFSAKYFSDALKVFKGDKVTIRFSSSVKPFTVTDAYSNLTQLILPVRLAN